MKAFLLLHSSNPIGTRINLLDRRGVMSAEITTGPYDVIAELEVSGAGAVQKLVHDLQQVDPNLGTILPCWQLGESDG